MKCPKCKSKINKDEKFCGNCGNEIISKNRKMQAIIACICCFAIVLSATIGGLYFYNSIETKTIENGEYTSFMEGFTDVLVTDEESAIEAVGSVSTVLGIDSVVDELKINNVQSVKDDRFYRMQQYYKDIPVFGRSIIVSADKNGNALSLTSNYKQIASDIYLVPKAAQTEITESIAELLKIDNLSKQNLSNDNLVIYNFGEKDVLAYSVVINGLGTIIVDANTAKVIHYIKLFKDITAEVKSKDDSVSSIGWQNDDGSYHLYNDEHKIEVFDVKGIDTVIDNEGSVHTNFKDYGIDTIYSKKNKFDTDAIILLNDIIDISNYYNDLGFSGFEQVHVAINDSYDNGKNARGGGGEFDGKDCAIILIGKKYNFANKDVTAHEYTHAVSGLIVNWSGIHTENSALNEAYSDIFGSLYENNQNPDWKMVHLSEVIRDLTEPSQTNSYDNMADIDDSDGYNQYTLSTIVSHSAYLMWNGIDGSENRKINATTLSEIWYRSMLLLQSNADFAQCRNAVELSARMMLKNNQLTEEQYKTVITAFESVGIENATFTYTETVKNKFDLSVLSSKGTEDVHYKLEIIKMPAIKVGPGIVNNEMPKLVMEKTAITGRQSLDLKDGTYVLRITDVSDERNISQSINIKIVVDGENSNAKDEVVVNTDFTEIIMVIVDSESGPDWALGLTEGYWESKIQTFELYKFNEDGTGKIYCVADIEVVDTTKLDELDSTYINSFTWKIDGDYLCLNDSCKLKLVSKSDNYNWDMGIYHNLPENEKFFYETDYTDDGTPSSNAVYLKKHKEKVIEDDTAQNIDGNPNQDDMKLYLDYLTNGGMSDIVSDYWSNEYIEISSCLIDMNDDGIFELLLIGTDKETPHIRGYETNSVIYGIQNGKVVILDEAYYGGGSIGGDYFFIKYDTEIQKHVIVREGTFRDGAYAGESSKMAYSYDGKVISSYIEVKGMYFELNNKVYEEQVQKLYNETSFGEVGETYHYFYKIDDQFVPKNQYEKAVARFIAPKDELYTMKQGTLNNPLGI